MMLHENASKQIQNAANGVISPASSQVHSTRPSLLPAFEPVSSSPVAALSRKRRFDDEFGPQDPAYPTPVPTSSTGILPSSPNRHPVLKRTVSTLSERSPLSNVPTLLVPDNGQPLYIGRSSNSCDYQLPYNRLISRRHVSVRYETPTVEHASGRLLIECLGWNGCIVRCKGRVEELGKDDVFIVGDSSIEIILDVMETRVILGWPEASQSPREGSPWNSSPTRRLLTQDATTNFASSPPVRARSPISPSPSRQLTRDLVTAPSTTVEIFEDPLSDDAANQKAVDSQRSGLQNKTAASTFDSLSSLSENENEENEPLVHSFGAFGANLLSRLNSFSATSPEAPRKLPQDQPERSPTKRPRRMPFNASPIRNHVINQLAFSRVHAVPVSQIFRNLPADLKNPNTLPSLGQHEELTTDVLRDLVQAISCVGEISRSGKDAAGKQLENEFYYVPDKDDNTMRRDAVVNGMGNSGLRSVRKNHKQYYWKRPRH